MKMRSIILAGVLVVGATPALADGHLVGTWKAVEGGGGAIVGSDHGGKDVSYTGDNDLTWTLRVEEQSGSGFHAQWCSQNKCEDVVGVERMNGGILMADEDGHFEGTVIHNKMELCYVESGKDVRVADCHILQKQE